MNELADRVILRLKEEGYIRKRQRTPEEKTEELLFQYKQLILSDKPQTKKLLAQIDDALNTIRDNPYYGIIPLHYFEGKTWEAISLDLNTHPRTIRKHKQKLIRKIAAVLFSDDLIFEIFN